MYSKKIKSLIKYTVFLISSLHYCSVIADTKTEEPKKFEWYGFIKPALIGSNRKVISFNNINLSAPTHAAASVQLNNQNQGARDSFQTQQSRIGLKFIQNEVTGTIEVDFVDFNKSSPTTQMVPRIRILSIKYPISDQTMILIGQDWDLMSPLNPFTYNLVAGNFLGGNIGFMRDQIQVIRKQNNLKSSFAIGMINSNPLNIDSGVEVGKLPTVSSSVSVQTSMGNIGMSGIYGKTRTSTTINQTRNAFALGPSLETENQSLNVRFESYYGKNTNSLGLLGIGKAQNDYSDQNEWGGFCSATLQLIKNTKIISTFGIAKIINSNTIAPLEQKADNSILNNGIFQNKVSRIGLEYQIQPNLSYNLELSRFQTKTKLITNKIEENSVFTLETGLLYRL